MMRTLWIVWRRVVTIMHPSTQIGVFLLPPSPQTEIMVFRFMQLFYGEERVMLHYDTSNPFLLNENFPNTTVCSLLCVNVVHCSHLLQYRVWKKLSIGVILQSTESFTRSTAEVVYCIVCVLVPVYCMYWSSYRLFNKFHDVHISDLIQWSLVRNWSNNWFWGDIYLLFWPLTKLWIDTG